MSNQLLSASNIKALASRVGIKRIHHLLPEEVRGHVKRFIENILRKAINVMQLDGAKTLSTKHVELNLPVVMFSENLSGKCKVKKNDTHCENLIFRKLSFARFVREIAKDFVTDLRISSNAFILLQHATEAFVVQVLKAARLLSAHAGRKTVNYADFNYAFVVSDYLKENASNTNLDKMSNFVPSIKQVLKTLKVEKGITSDAASQLNFIVNVVANKIGCTARSMNEKKTLGSKVIQTALLNVFPVSELSTHSVSEGAKALMKFENYKKSGSAKVKTSAKAGLVFSVSRVMNLLKSTCKQRVSIAAAVYLAAVLEYISAEILYLSEVAADKHKHSRISTECIKTATSTDDELSGLMKKLGIAVIC